MPPNLTDNTAFIILFFISRGHHPEKNSILAV